jgi:hypothetical protein
MKDYIRGTMQAVFGDDVEIREWTQEEIDGFRERMEKATKDDLEAYRKARAESWKACRDKILY